MTKTMNIPNWLRVAVAVSIVAGAYVVGIYIGDHGASARARLELSGELSEAWTAAHANDHLIAHQSAEIAEAQARLDAIEAILRDCETIHGDRGPDGVWTFAMFSPDGTAREVSGRTLDVLIGVTNG